MCDLLGNLSDWIDRMEERQDFSAPAPAQALGALLDHEPVEAKPGDIVRPGGHWLYFLPTPRQSEIGDDGHPRRGGFLPPIPLPRRMWAGSRVKFIRPVVVGQPIAKTSRIRDVSVKEGKSGTLVFVKVQHEIRDDRGVLVEEEQDIVYRDAPKAGAPVALGAVSREAETPDWSRDIVPTEVLLFRYSALTLNGHRIHYDRPYATQAEGYPGLVVHGPLIATLLLDLVLRNRPDATLSEFAFKAVSPLFDLASFKVCGRALEGGKQLRLWAQDADGRLAMEASALVA